MKANRFAIIGCGKQAEKHAACVAEIPGLEMVFFDLDHDLSRNLAQRHNSPWSSSLDDILADSQVAATLISTPTPTHYELITASLKADKDVLCEKPITDRLETMADIQRLEREHNRFVMAGNLYRFVPTFEQARDLLRPQADGGSPPLGKPLSALFRIGGRGNHRAWKHSRAHGGGAVNEMLVHMVDLAMWLLGPITDVRVAECSLLAPERIIDGQAVTADAEDYVQVGLSNEAGTRIICQADFITAGFRQYVEIMGDNGSFMGSIQDQIPSFAFLNQAQGGVAAGRTDLSGSGPSVLQRQMNSFVRAVLKNGRPDRNTSTDSVELMALMDRVKGQCEL